MEACTYAIAVVDQNAWHQWTHLKAWSGNHPNFQATAAYYMGVGALAASGREDATVKPTQTALSASVFYARGYMLFGANIIYLIDSEIAMSDARFVQI